MDSIKKGVFEISGRSYPCLIDAITYSANAVNEGCISFSGIIVDHDKPIKLSAPFPGGFLAKAFNLPKPTIKNVIFNNPATVVLWSDGTKTVVKCQPGDVYSKETGLALCIAKKFLGNKGNFNEVFKRWIPEEG